MSNPFRLKQKDLKHTHRKVPKCKPCPKCGSRKRQDGYGFAAGPLGAYTFCAANKCGVLLDCYPDTSGLPEDQAEAARSKAKAYLDRVWNNTGYPSEN